MTAVIFGMGCKKSIQIEAFLNEIALEAHLPIEVRHNQNVETFLAYKIRKTPALSIESKVLYFPGEVNKSVLLEFVLNSSKDTPNNQKESA